MAREARSWLAQSGSGYGWSRVPEVLVRVEVGFKGIENRPEINRVVDKLIKDAKPTYARPSSGAAT